MAPNDSSLDITVLGTQSAKQRFHGEQCDSAVDGDGPAFAAWRCNLVQSTPACAHHGQVLMHIFTDWAVTNTQSLLCSIQERNPCLHPSLFFSEAFAQPSLDPAVATIKI
jgi:hypothetical protein